MDDEGTPFCLNCTTIFSTHKALRCHWARRIDCQRGHHHLERRQRSIVSQSTTANESPDSSSDDLFPEGGSLPDDDPMEEDPNLPYGGLLQKHQQHIASWNEHGPLPETLVPKVELGEQYFLSSLLLHLKTRLATVFLVSKREAAG